MESLLKVRHKRRAVSELSLNRSERYMITLCDQALWCDLRDGYVANALYNQLERAEYEGFVKVLCANLLNDCIQILVEVESEESLKRFIERFESLSFNWVEWRKESQQYKLAKEDSVKDFAYYVFMGPYRRGLLDVDERNVFWRAWNEDAVFDFGETCNLNSFSGGSLRSLMTVESMVEQVIVAV